MQLQSSFEADIEAINKISAVPTILEVICRTTGMRFAAVARVTEDKWVCCAVRDEIEFGVVPGGELDVSTTFCHKVRQNFQPVLVDNIAQQELLAGHPVPLKHGFQSYISFPIVTKQGEFFGTLCAIDPEPMRAKTMDPAAMFEMFGELITFHLQAVDDLKQAEKKLLEEQNIAELREQFIAILGHDLRNPVGAVLMVSELLLRMPLDEQIKSLAVILQNSSYRMKELIENILDFANGRLGNGITINCSETTNLESTLRQVINELLIIWPNRTIDTQFDLSGAVCCDEQRIAQLLSNLLGNALKYGNPSAPVLLEATNSGGRLKLSVTNTGPMISDVVKERLFQPFYRGKVEPDKEGLGLGLYIASEIARAHGGAIDVESTPTETRFTLCLQ
jgi:signal transduction histidine kinase